MNIKPLMSHSWGYKWTKNLYYWLSSINALFLLNQLHFNCMICLWTYHEIANFTLELMCSSLSCLPDRMYKSSCTCEILHRTPLVRRVAFGLDNRSIVDALLRFYHLEPNGFELYTCACWTLLIPTVLCWNQNKLCTGSKVTIAYNMSGKKNTLLIYTGQMRNLEGTPAWNGQG